MPLFLDTLDRAASGAGLTVWLHTESPTMQDVTRGRTFTGGGAYECGLVLPAAGIVEADNGERTNAGPLDFGIAAANVGAVTHWSAVTGDAAVAFGPLPRCRLMKGDPFTINPMTLLRR